MNGGLPDTTTPNDANNKVKDPCEVHLQLGEDRLCTPPPSSPVHLPDLIISDLVTIPARP